MSKLKESSYEFHMNEMIEERLSMMEGKGYEFGKRFCKRDYIITMIIILLCLAAIIAGAYL